MPPVNYYADNYAVPFPVLNDAAAEGIRVFSFTWVTTILATDIIHLCTLENQAPGIVLCDWFIDMPDIDTGTTWAMQLGDTDTAAKFMATSTVGQSAGKLTMSVNGVAGAVPVAYKYSGGTVANYTKDLILTCVTAAQTSATVGKIIGKLEFKANGGNEGV